MTVGSLTLLSTIMSVSFPELICTPFKNDRSYTGSATNVPFGCPLVYRLPLEHAQRGVHVDHSTINERLTAGCLASHLCGHCMPARSFPLQRFAHGTDADVGHLSGAREAQGIEHHRRHVARLQQVL